MKKITLLTITTFFIINVLAQIPQAISYQAVVRDSDNHLITNQQVGIRISILKGTANGTEVYSETHIPLTNSNGLVTLEIGTGTTSDDISLIDWSDDIYFIKTETDPSGGIDYTITGISQILSVPYALHAKTAETLTGTVNEKDPVFTASPAADIEASDMYNWNTAFGWGDHAAEDYLKEENDPSLAEIFDLTGSETGDMLIFNGTKWVKFTPAYLTEFIETDPTWEGDENHTANIGRTGYVGIGTTNPGAQLEIYGLMMLSPLETPVNCNESIEGSMYYDKSLKILCYCNGTHWITLDGRVILFDK